MTSGIIGLSVQNLAPINDILDRIGFIIWGARAEQQKLLEGPKPRRQIEGPKASDADEEIPF
jgi:hypothetical protein